MSQLVSRLRHFLVLTALLLPAPFFGGVGGFPLAINQTLIVIAFFLLVIQKFFFDEHTPDEVFRIFAVPLALFGGFVAYVWLQWACGGLVFLGLPGSIASYRTFDYSVQLVCYLFLFLLCLDFLSVFKRIEWVIIWIFLELTLLIALGFYQVYSDLVPLRKFYGVFEPTNIQIFFSSFPNANHYGAFLWICSVFLIAFILHSWAYFEWPVQADVRTLLSVIFILAGFFVGWSIFCASAKAAFVFFGLTAFFLPWLLLPKWQRIPWLMVFALLVSTMMGSLVVSKFVIYFKEWQLIASALMTRLSIYSEMLGIIFDFPFFGVGLGASKFITSIYQVQDVEHFCYSHLFNHHLELLADTGLIGYGLFFSSFVTFGFIGLRGCQMAESASYRIYGIASFFALVCLGVLSLLDEYLLTPAVSGIAIFHLAVLARCATAGFPSQNETHHLFSWIFSWLKHFKVLTSFCVMMVAGLMIFHAVRTGWAAFLIRPGECDTKVLAQTVKLDPFDAERLVFLGDACYLKSEPQFMWAYEEATHHAPTWWRAWILLGRAKISTGRIEEGFEDVEQAAYLMPYNRDAYLYLVLTALRIADREKFEEKRNIFIKKAEYWVNASRSLKRPLTVKDHDYLSMHTARGVLSKEDYERLVTLLKRMET